MRERQKVRKASTVAQGLTQGSADGSMVQVALLAVMQKDALQSKKAFDKETLLAIASDKDGIRDLVHQYDSDDWKQGGLGDTQLDVERGETEQDVAQSKEEMVALKMAKQRLEIEVKQEEHLSEQLKLSSLKQVYHYDLSLIHI